MSYLSRLYTSSDNEKELDSYMHEHELELLMATDDKTSSLLSAIALGYSFDKISPNDTSMLEAKGFIKKVEDEYILLERGKRIVSDYPLFGEYQKTRKYPLSFFPILIASTISKELSSRATHWTRYFASDFFTNIFPSRDKEELSRAAITSVRALLDLGVLRDNLGRMTIRKDSSLSFMSLKEEDKLSWILYPYFTDIEREKAAKAINLLFRLRGVKEDEIDIYLSRIEAITGFRIDNLTPFYDFNVLYREEGIINATEIDYTPAEDGILSSDFTLSYSGYTDIPLYLLCQPEKADVTVLWTLTRKSLKSAFSLGYKPTEIKEILNSISREALPDTLDARIDGWYESFSSLTAERGVILTSDSRNAKMLDSLPLLKIHILSHPSENIFIMNPSTEEEWRRVLQFSGFDMLGETKGWEMHRPEREPEFVKYAVPAPLKAKREVPFSKNLRKMLLASSGNKLRRMLVESGFIFTEDAKEFVETVEGLYYQEKLRTINEAIIENDNLYIETAKGTIAIEKPLSIEKSEDCLTLITDSRSYNVDKIWKVGRLPGYIKSLD